MNFTLATWKAWFSQNQKKVFEEYFHFLRFKSISTDPDYHRECERCALWLKMTLEKIGFHVELWPTSGKPVVFAEHYSAKKGSAKEGAPTLLLYHHYDVQPVDPLELWHSDPFEPRVIGQEVYARGAQDNKGQCFYSIAALRAFFEICKELPFNVKVFIEGEEECGSEGTAGILQEKKERLKADHLLVIDSGLPAKGVPAITLGGRGLVAVELTCISADGDMHSGMMGGIAYNPVRALITALSKLWDETGKVTIPHFYEDVKTLSKEELAALEIEVDEKEIKQKFGLRAVCPEPGFSIGESSTIRPVVELNGLAGGYVGKGFKTVLPAKADAKLSCRLVPNQDPDKIAASLKHFLQKLMPKGVELQFHFHRGAKAFSSSASSWIAKEAAKAYTEVLGAPCKKILSGGSIPIVAELSKICGAEMVGMGYGLDEDQIHAPNEHFGLDRFEQGFLTICQILSQFR